MSLASGASWFCAKICRGRTWPSAHIWTAEGTLCPLLYSSGGWWEEQWVFLIMTPEFSPQAVCNIVEALDFFRHEFKSWFYHSLAVWAWAFNILLCILVFPSVKWGWCYYLHDRVIVQFKWNNAYAYQYLTPSKHTTDYYYYYNLGWSLCIFIQDSFG